MDKSEPTLVPEWLRSAGSSSGGGSSCHHLSTSTSHSDTLSLAHNNRNRTSRSIGDFDSPRSASLNRTYSGNSRRSLSSNGSSRHAYSSFSRTNRDKDRDKEKERSYYVGHWDHDSDPLGNLSIGRIGKDPIRQSHSVLSRKHGDLLDHKGLVDLKNSSNISRYNANGGLARSAVGTGGTKAVLDKDFPALGAEERQVAQGIGKVPSPGLNTAVQGVPVGSSGLGSGDGWSSALVEVPRVTGNGSSGSSSIQGTATSGASFGSSTTTMGLNMAEALAQPPSRARTPPQSSVTTQKLEKLAIKQSRQLIPVTPSMPKSLGLITSDKLKPKTPVRSADINGVAKSSLQHLSSHYSGGQFLSGGAPTKSDAPKKFLVLKPVRDHSVPSSPKDATSSPNNTCTSNQSIVASPVASAVLRGANNTKHSTVDSRAASFPIDSGAVAEKKPSPSQAQSRSDFFNLVRKKSLKLADSAVQEPGDPISSDIVDKSGKASKEVGFAPKSPHAFENGCEAARNYDDSEAPQILSNVAENGGNPKILLYPEEEEAAFLRSLGWDENSGEEDEGLTEEEINSFYEKYMKLKPSLKLCRDMQLRLTLQAESHANRLGGASPEFGTSSSRSKA